tara:strand:+ start:31601 stop:32341 length:741 start_codon:yes stop_codon:yes gene_type:complete
MANRKTFNDFREDKPHSGDYVIGFSEPVPGGERRFRLADLKGFIHPSEVVDVTGAVEFSSDDIINGKIYHVANGEETTQNQIDVSLPLNPEHLMEFVVVNTTDNIPVNITTRAGTPLQARGTILRRKFDTAVIYWDGNAWHGYGDLVANGGATIKNITSTHQFDSSDVDALLHVNASSDVDIVLPNPVGLLSGTQFYVYNMSDSAKVTLKSTDSEISARSNVLRRKYDDAVVYTDGVKWFATGDLS